MVIREFKTKKERRRTNERWRTSFLTQHRSRLGIPIASRAKPAKQRFQGPKGLVDEDASLHNLEFFDDGIQLIIVDECALLHMYEICSVNFGIRAMVRDHREIADTEIIQSFPSQTPPEYSILCRHQRGRK